MAVTHLFVEKQVREYYKTVPLKTMEKIFDSPVKTLADLESVPLTEEKKKILAEMIERERKSRAELARWLPAEREKFLALKKVEKEHSALIESLIENLFHGFQGGEVHGSEAAKKILEQISKLRTGLGKETNDLIQMSLRETFRDYQIMNNSFVRGRKDLIVRLKSATEGFVVEQRAPGEVKVLLADRVNDTSFLLRVEKPADMQLAPGEALKVTIDTPNGKEFRVFSLASSPKQDYVEIAVKDSDSDFKKAFTQLKPGAKVSIERAKGAMHFDTEKPAVMIAGGIGITPFRSMMQYAADEKLKTPMWLFYANREQIAFGDEFTKLAADNPDLNITNVLSRPDSSWTGARGRVDEAFLAKTVPNMPSDAVYYIVGPPEMVTGTRAALKKLGVPEERIKFEIFAYNEGPKAPPAGAAAHSGEQTATGAAAKAEDPERTICFCQSVSASKIEKAVQDGATTMEDIQTTTMAATGCGGCQCKVQGILSCELKKMGKTIPIVPVK